MLNGLKDLGQRYPNLVKNVRGRGTFCAFDCDTMAKRDQLVDQLKVEGLKKLIIEFCVYINQSILNIVFFQGVQTGGAGPVAVRLRPSLVFQPHHAAIFLDRLQKALNKMDNKV